MPSVSKHIPQKWYDENRERFDAETTQAPRETKPCQHYFIRVMPTRVQCKFCHAGWFDNGDWKVKDGKVIEVRR